MILGKKHGFKITLEIIFYSSAISDRWIQVENNAKRLGDHLIEGPFTNLDMLWYCAKSIKKKFLFIVFLYKQGSNGRDNASLFLL